MSGPIRPALRVEEQDGSPSVRPVNTIKVTNGTLTDDGSATVSVTTGGGGGSPGGSTTQVQFNDAGSFAGDADLTWDKTNNLLTIGPSGVSGGEARARKFTSYDGAGVITMTEESGSESDITITPKYTETDPGIGVYGQLHLAAKRVEVGLPNTDGYISSYDAKNLILETNRGTNSGTITINDGVNGAIEITPNGTGLVKVSNLEVNGAYELPTVVTGSNDYVLTAQTDGTTAWAAAGGGSPGGSTTQVQYNDTGSFAGSANLTFDGTSLSPNLVKLADGGNIGSFPYALGFASDDDSGLYRSAANQLAFSTGGNQVLTFGGFPRQVLLGSHSDTTATALSTYGAQDIVISTNTTTNSGTITINNGVNGAIEIVPNGTGLLKVTNLEVNGVYALPTVVTGSNDYVLTAQTDGTTAWAEAGGGGGSGGFADYQYNTSNGYTGGYKYYPIMQMPPWGNARTGTYTTYSNANSDKPILAPFIAPETGLLDELTFYISGAAATACELQVGIYDSDANGNANNLLAYVVGDITSTGVKTSSSWLDSTGSATTAPSLTKGNTYWVVNVRDTTSIAFSFYGTYVTYGATACAKATGATATFTEISAWRFVTATLTLPATISDTDYLAWSSQGPLAAMVSYA